MVLYCVENQFEAYSKLYGKDKLYITQTESTQKQHKAIPKLNIPANAFEYKNISITYKQETLGSNATKIYWSFQIKNNTSNDLSLVAVLNNYHHGQDNIDDWKPFTLKGNNEMKIKSDYVIKEMNTMYGIDRMKVKVYSLADATALNLIGKATGEEVTEGRWQELKH